MPERASLILINDHREVLLIERVKGDRHYWVFPGEAKQICLQSEEVLFGR